LPTLTELSRLSFLEHDCPSWEAASICHLTYLPVCLVPSSSNNNGGANSTISAFRKLVVTLNTHFKARSFMTGRDAKNANVDTSSDDLCDFATRKSLVVVYWTRHK
jgi:hypothetical protein